MKKFLTFILIALSLFSISGCFALYSNPLYDLDEFIFESEDKTIRYELGVSSSPYGRLYVTKDGVKHVFTTENFRRLNLLIIVFDTHEGQKSPEYYLNMSYKKIHAFKHNFDIMYLKDENEHNITNDILDNLDVTLYRNKEKKMNPLNYFYCRWSSAEDGIMISNNNLKEYMYFKSSGKIKGMDVIFTFENNEFLATNEEGLIILSGTFKFKDKNIILNPHIAYEQYPQEMTLKFILR